MMFKRQLRCSFCRRSDAQVAKLVAGPRVYICDSCVETAAWIMAQAGDGPNTTLPQPTFAQRLLGRLSGSGKWSGTHLQSDSSAAR